MDLLFQRRHFPKLNGVRSVSERALESPGEPYQFPTVSHHWRFGEKISGDPDPNSSNHVKSTFAHREIFGNWLNISPLVFPGDHVQKLLSQCCMLVCVSESYSPLQNEAPLPSSSWLVFHFNPRGRHSEKTCRCTEYLALGPTEPWEEFVSPGEKGGNPRFCPYCQLLVVDAYGVVIPSSLVILLTSTTFIWIHCTLGYS
jgi:hypothetical protein